MTCKNCEHGCHCFNGGSCTSCDCKNCDHDIEEALEKLQEVIKPVATVEFEPDFDLTEH